ncbi:MAG: Regulator of sigma-W protease RasP [Firmicutes bacterium ADurb.Bin182]|nr:MAG: Regulator of sigma-W protease RasP [Firmicutes bacterium ADurb.Bin182]
MENILSIVVALLVLSIFIFVHELGHYGAGRILGFKIVEFSIGMGPALLKKDKKGIRYSVRAFPIGGMCKFYGEDEAVRNNESFNAHKPWKRMIVTAAGPVMNILFALIFAIVTLTVYGDYVTGISSFAEDSSPAQSAGLMPGDTIYAIDGKRIEYYAAAVDAIRRADGEEAVITVERNGKKLDFVVKDMYNPEKGYNFLGVNIEPVRKHYGLFEAIGASFAYIWSMIMEMFKFLGSIFTKGVQKGDVMGPVGTISFIGQAVRMGFESLLRLGSLISVNLAIVNLLPLPALDGGRIVFQVVETVRGKPVSAEKEGMVHFVGIILLFALIIFLTFNDISTMFGG